MVSWNSMERKLSLWFLIAAFVFVFGWFGIDKLRNPLLWTGFLPLWIDGFFGISVDVWIVVIGFIEIFLAALLLIPVRRIRQLGTLLVVLHLAGVVWQVGWNDIGVRDIGLLISALALLVLI